jgi:protein-L-isoaspartate O-methyltransferase
MLPEAFTMQLRRALWTVAALLIFALSAAAAAVDVERTGGPYVPTPQAVVDAMLDLAKVGPTDFVIDLGSGDGRIVLTAAQRHKARGLGIDIDPELVEQSNAEARKRGVAERVTFEQQDVLKARIDNATVLTLYLLPGMMQSLAAKLMRELKPGTRIVSHDFPFGDWKPDREVTVDITEKYGTAGQWKSTLFYWVVPAQVHGTWSFNVPAVGDEPIEVVLQQQYQYLTGGANTGGKRSLLSEGKLEADHVRFKLALPAGVYEFRGIVDGERMRGTAVHGGQSVAWTAARALNPKAALR